jgi:hypothetical protein
MEALHSSEMLVPTYQNTRCRNLKAHNMNMEVAVSKFNWATEFIKLFFF